MFWSPYVCRAVKDGLPSASVIDFPAESQISISVRHELLAPRHREVSVRSVSRVDPSGLSAPMPDMDLGVPRSDLASEHIICFSSE